MAQCDPQALLDQAACFDCLTPGEWDLLIVQLLCEIKKKTVPPPIDTDMILQLTAPFVTGVPHADVAVDYPDMSLATDINLNCTVDTAQDLGISNLDGMFSTNSDYLSFLSFPALATVGTFVLAPGSNFAAPITALSFPALATVAQTFSIRDFHSVTAMSFPSLTTVGDVMTIAGNTIINSISLPSLLSVGGLTLTGNAFLGNFSAPSLTTSTGQITIDTNNALSNLNFDSLATLAGPVGGIIIGDTNITGAFSFPALASTGDGLQLAFTNVTSLGLPSLVTIGVGINLGSALVVSDTTSVTLTSIDIHSLTTVAQINVGFNGGLTTILVNPALAATGFSAQGDALTEATVDAILASLDAGGQLNGQCDVSGGSNSAPSAAGLVSVANLTGKGWTVNTN